METGLSGFAIGRRAILKQASIVMLGIGADGLLQNPASAAEVNDLGVLQTAVGREHVELAALSHAHRSGLLSPETSKLVRVFMGHHQQHRDALEKLVVHLGGTPVPPRPAAEYADELDFSALRSEADLVELASWLARGTAATYVGQTATLKDPATARLFAAIGADEAMHWATLNNATGGSIPASAYLFD